MWAQGSGGCHAARNTCHQPYRPQTGSPSARQGLPALGSDSKGVPSLLLAALVGEWREGITFLQTDPSYSTACQIKSPLTEAQLSFQATAPIPSPKFY